MNIEPRPKEPGTGWCPECKQRTKIQWEDFGIGGYEFWGAKGCDVRWEAVCGVCGEGLEGLEGEEP